MPLFEFVCQTCQGEFEELVRSASAVDEVCCPECGSPKIKKKISTFASKASGGSQFSFSPSSAASCAPSGT